jgi:arabinofuranan 3-O-arabinosyltransferase
LGTGWVAAADDSAPALTITLPRDVTTTGAQFQVDQFLAASRPRKVVVSLGGGSPRTLTVDEEGRVSWPATRAKKVTVRFVATNQTRSVDAAGWVTVLPVGVSELVIDGAPKASPAPRTAQTGAPCGFGPALVVDGERYDTRVDGTVADLVDGRPLTWQPCGSRPVSLDVGRHRLEAAATEIFTPRSLVLRPTESSSTSMRGPGTSGSLTQQWASPTRLRVSLDERGETSLIVLPQNFNAGWRATTESGEVLAPIRVNGWQQGWVVPAGTSGQVSMVFATQRWFTAGLVAGAIAVVLAAAGMVLTRRRGSSVPEPPTAARWVLVATLALVVAAFGAVGAASVVVAVAVVLVCRSRAPVPLATAGFVLVAGAWALSGLWPTEGAGVTSTVVQLLALTAVSTSVAAGWSAWGGTGSPRLARRIRGRSSQ